jgi:hypothetical protein
MTEQVPEPENEENEWSTQYQKWDFALPVLVPVLEMGLPFPVLVNCAFGHLHYTCTFQFCPIEEILWGILNIQKQQKQILRQNMPPHAALSPTSTMATTL